VSRADVAALVAAVTDAWADDPDSDVVWAGDHEGRRGVRMRQTVRDFTTVWFVVGDRTVSIEAYVLPAPPSNRSEVFRQCLVRNAATRRVHFALDADASIVLVGRIPVQEVGPTELELVLGEVYELVEVGFPPLVRAAFGREKKA
jgi:hypothetical protein